MRLASDPHPFGIGDVAKPAFSYFILAAPIAGLHFILPCKMGKCILKRVP